MEITEQVALAPYTTLGVGGSARYFATAGSREEVAAAYAAARERTGASPIILGDGTNVLFADGVLPRLVLRVALLGKTVIEETDDSVLLRVGAGEDWDELVAYTTEAGWAGLENLSGIPGTVGAAPVQNINAYGVSVAETVDLVTVYDPASNRERVLSNAECRFGYRDSLFKQAGRELVILDVVFRLRRGVSAELSYESSAQSIARIIAERGEEASPATVRAAVLTARGNIGMLRGHYRSAGSFFKNTILDATDFAALQAIIENDHADTSARFTPWHWALPDGQVKVSTAFLLECTPYNKTTYGTERINGVGFSPKHSLSIVTEPGATAAAVREFAARVEAAVLSQLGVRLEREVISIES